MEQVSEFIASPGGLALKAALLAAFLDFVFGTFAAIRDGTFALDAVAAFVRKHLAGRVLPIGLALLVGYVSADSVLLAAATAALAAYTLETMGSIYASLSTKAGVSEIPRD